jgi:hypothetical protein
MQGVLRFQEPVYESLFREGKLVRTCFVNVLLFGLLHAGFVLVFAKHVWSVSGVSVAPTLQTQIAIICSGVMIAFFMHAGAALFFWVFTRGLGGRPSFLPLYLNLGVGFIALWPLAPVVSAYQAGLGGPILTIVLAMLSLYAVAVVFFGLKSASGLSALRMAASMVLTAAFVACFLYLWM